MDGKQGLASQPMRFSHITIGEDDADEVIQAGIVEQCQAEPVPEPQPEPQPQPQPELEPEPEPAPAPAPKKPANDDGYRETTLEDLKGESMPFAQKAVLIGAVILIVVAVVYWFTTH